MHEFFHCPARSQRFDLFQMKTLVFVLVVFACGNSFSQEKAVDRVANSKFERFESSHDAMGVEFKVTVYVENETAAKAAFRQAFFRIDQLESILSDYRSSSETRKLCRSAPHDEWQVISKDLLAVLKASQRHFKMTDGKFDPTVGNLTFLWRQARKKKKLPSSAKIEKAKQSVGFEFIEWNENQQVKLLHKDTRLDFGGIAKGFAADSVIQLMTERGIKSALVDASGDIVASDPPPGEEAWNIKLDAKVTGKTTLFKIRNQAIATSGDRFQFIKIDGQKFSHIVNPETGIGVRGPRSVTVIAKSGCDADAFASALSVMGGKAGIEFADKHDELEALVIENDANDKEVRFQSNGIGKYFSNPAR